MKPVNHYTSTTPIPDWLEGEILELSIDVDEIALLVTDLGGSLWLLSWLSHPSAKISEQANEWLDVLYVGKDGREVQNPKKVPMTYEGFKRFCRENYGEVQHYFENTDKYYNDFCGICLRIKEEIRENQIVGGMLGFYNPSITQRLNGLTEKVQNEVKNVEKFDFDE